MDLDHFINQTLLKSTQQNVFFHFTDTRNLPSIRKNGLLSMRRLREKKIKVPAVGGNQASLDADIATGVDAFVHLCFMIRHPMVKYAQDDGRILKAQYLKIRPQIIKLPGVMMTTDVANQNGGVLRTPSETLDLLDLEVIYTWMKWKDPAINARLQAAHRCEILVPDQVPPEMIKNLNG